MNEKEKLLDRFVQGEGTEILFIPQCNFCKYNKSDNECGKFPDGKPKKYADDVAECSHREVMDKW